MTMQQPARSHHAPYSRTARSPVQSLRSALERSKLAQAVFDVFAVLYVFLFLSITGVGIAFAVFCLFFASD